MIGHGAVRRELAAIAALEEPPHALLFAGSEGTGRTTLALELARLFDCESAGAGRAAAACGECRACRLIDTRRHPDVIHVGPGDAMCRPRPGDSHPAHPDSRDIRICQVRGLIDLAARFPFEARRRVIIIEPAERIARDASHTILKTLEEPPGHTVFVLVTSAPDSIIETIRSRCRRLDIPLVPRAEIEAGLRARGVESGLATRAAGECRGRPARALAFAARPELMEDGQRLQVRCATLAAARTAERFSYAGDLAERGGRDRAALAVELDAWEAFWERQLRTGLGTSPAHSLEALRAVGEARGHILAQVATRAALELMLLRFPRVTLPVESEGASSPDD